MQESTSGLSQIDKVVTGLDETDNNRQQEIDNIDLDVLPPHLWERARQILRKHESMWTGKLGIIRATEHRTQLKEDTTPVRQMPYRMGHKERDIVKSEVAKMLEQGLIRPSSSEWPSLVV